MIDQIIKEPLGGAHRSYDEMAENIRETLSEQLQALEAMPRDQLLAARKERIRSYGFYQ